MTTKTIDTDPLEEIAQRLKALEAPTKGPAPQTITEIDAEIERLKGPEKRLRELEAAREAKLKEQERRQKQAANDAFISQLAAIGRQADDALASNTDLAETASRELESAASKLAAGIKQHEGHVSQIINALVSRGILRGPELECYSEPQLVIKLCEQVESLTWHPYAAGPADDLPNVWLEGKTARPYGRVFIQWTEFNNWGLRATVLLILGRNNQIVPGLTINTGE